MKRIPFFLGAVILLALSLAHAEPPTVPAAPPLDAEAAGAGVVRGAVHTGMTECHDQAKVIQCLDGDPETPFTPLAKSDEAGSNGTNGTGKAK